MNLLLLPFSLHSFYFERKKSAQKKGRKAKQNQTKNNNVNIDVNIMIDPIVCTKKNNATTKIIELLN